MANLIELPVGHNREALPHVPGDLEAQTPLQLLKRGHRSMEIVGLRWGPRQSAREAVIRGVHSFYNWANPIGP